MARAHRVRRAGRTDRERRQATGLARIGRVHPAELYQRLRVEMQFVGQRPEDRENLLAVIGLVAGLHGGVGGEHEALATASYRQREVTDVAVRKAGHPRRDSQGGQGGMALVEVEQGGRDPHGVECANPTYPKEGVLRQADRPVALVQA